ncbi:DUF3313 family protein [Brevundimonas sp.]|uniref:DUF3313 family protein n=1 Tax=Brevundimonas sp. TaxID=1871086 RepID=UPI0035B0C900
MSFRVPTVAALGAVLAALGACATPPAAQSGFLSNYSALTPEPATLASIRQNRDEATLANVDRLALEPAVFVGGAEEGLSAEEAGWVLAEVDRQVCYELSERFTVLEPSQPGAQATVRMAVTGLSLTNPAGSGLSAVANWFIPGPIGVRAPGSTGGLAAEGELVLVPDGRQAAAITWARNAKVVGFDTPSLSRLGDALQLAEPLGDAVGDAFAPEGREVREIADPDPCARFGPRTRPAGFLARMATGLYDPGMSAAPRETSPDE